jgi:hypothetical protein
MASNLPSDGFHRLASYFLDEFNPAPITRLNQTRPVSQLSRRKDSNKSLSWLHRERVLTEGIHYNGGRNEKEHVFSLLKVVYNKLSGAAAFIGVHSPNVSPRQVAVSSLEPWKKINREPKLLSVVNDLIITRKMKRYSDGRPVTHNSPRKGSVKQNPKRGKKRGKKQKAHR